MRDEIDLAKCYDDEGMVIKGSMVDVDYRNAVDADPDHGHDDASSIDKGNLSDEELIDLDPVQRRNDGESSRESVNRSNTSDAHQGQGQGQAKRSEDQISSSQSQPQLQPPSPSPSSSISDPRLSYSKFFSQPWVSRGTPELLFIKRSSRPSDSWSSHVAFPGGRREPSDENGLYTAMRETWEEVGIDLAEDCFLNVGALDDREITTSLGKRLLMVLSPHGELGVGGGRRGEEIGERGEERGEKKEERGEGERKAERG